MNKNKKQYNNKDIKYFCDYNNNIFNNIKEYHYYISRKKYLLKHGYSPNAVWNTDAWFVDIMSDILQEHHEYNEKYLDLKYDGNIKLQQDIELMMTLLKAMKEHASSLEYDDKATREEFFKLFSKNFHALWN